MSDEQAAEGSEEPKSKGKGGCLPIIIALAVVGVVVYSCSTLTQGATSTWSAQTLSTRLINPGSVNVIASVTNTGSKAAKPNCTVRVSDPSGAYTGFDSPIFDEDVAPGASKNFNMNIVVKGDGARFVTSSEITCE